MLGSSLTLQLAGEVRYVSWPDVFTLEYEGKFIYRDVGEPIGLGPALLLHKQTLSSAFVASGNVLQLEFLEGTRVTIEPNDHYESWDLNLGSTRADRLICMPGGEVVRRDEQNESHRIQFTD